MAFPEDEPFIEPISLRDEPRIGSSLRRARSSESTAVWAVVGLLGFAAGGYAIHVARRPGPPVPQPPPIVITREVEPAPRPKRLTIVAPIAAAKTRAQATIQSTVAAEARPERKAVDPIEGFDSGAAFDNPPSPGRYGQRTSGLLERATPAPGPTAPDPSFRTPR